MTSTSSRRACTKHSVASVALALAVAGCTVGPNYNKPQTKAKDAFAGVAVYDPASTQPTTRPSEQAVIAQWWSTFGDKTLDSLIDRAIVANYDVKEAQARVRESRALIGVERSAWYPEVNANGSYTRARRSENVGGAAGGSGGSGAPIAITPERYSDLYQAGFDVSWEIDVFGGTRRAVEAAVADLQAQEEARNNVLLTLLGDVANNYVQYRGTQQTIIATQNNLKAQQDTLELTRTRFRAGLTSDLDVARAEAQVSTTAATLPTLQISLKQFLHRLGVLLGQDPTSLAAELAQPGAIPGVATEVPVGLPSDLLRRRPDVRQAERQLAASNARIGVAVADYFPKFSLVGALGLQSDKFKSLGNGDSLFWNIGPSISWNVFNGNRTRSQVEVQNAQQEQALANYERTVLTSLEDVENALTAYDREQSRRQSLADAVSSNQRAVNLSQQLYERGLGDFLDVLTAQQALFSSQDQLARSEAQVSANLVALYKALGGGWDVAAEQLSSAQNQKTARAN
jgi:multidrug efflux system outer membrane protein